jgi:adenosylcobinamide-GDP ribazoletransferase
MITSFLAAMRRLSVLPLGERPAEPEGQEGDAVALYPLAGLAVGAVPALALVACRLIGLRPPLPEALAVSALALVTGMRHLGELGRTTEAMLSPRPALGALEAMREARLGAAGTSAVVLVLLVKYAALAALRGELGESTVGLVLALLLVGCLGRWAAVVLATYSEYARPEGGGDEAVFATAGSREVRWGLAFAAAAVVALGILGFQTVGVFRALLTGALALAAVSVFAWLAAVYFSRRFGGATGECMGAVIEVAEALVLVMVCLLPATGADGGWSRAPAEACRAAVERKAPRRAGNPARVRPKGY